MSAVTPVNPSPTTRFNLLAILSEEKNQVVPRSPLSPFFLGNKPLHGRTPSPAARVVPDVLLQGPGHPFSRHTVKGQKRLLTSPDLHQTKKGRFHTTGQDILVPSPSSSRKMRSPAPGSLDQVVPRSAEADNTHDCCARQLPSIVTGKTKVLHLFDGSDIFASREE